MKNLALIALGAMIIVTLGHASGPDERDVARSEYCSMVALHKDTAGEFGWPDYKGAFDEECK